MTSGDGKQKTSITSQTKLYKETLENINIFPLINLVVAVVFFFAAIDLLLLQFISSKSIILFILLFLFVSSNQVS